VEDEIRCMAADTYHVYTGAGKKIQAWRRGTEVRLIFNYSNAMMNNISDISCANFLYILVTTYVRGSRSRRHLAASVWPKYNFGR